MTKEREIAMIALMAAFIVVLRFFPPLQIGFVPITAQSLGVMLAGTVLGAKRGFLAVLLFVALAILGLPVLASGTAGMAIFVSPSMGFILGFPIAAFVTGWVMEKMTETSVLQAAIMGSVIGCILVLYFFGVIGLAARTDLDILGATIAMAPYIVGDLIKAVLTGLITKALFQARPEWVLTR